MDFSKIYEQWEKSQTPHKKRTTSTRLPEDTSKKQAPDDPDGVRQSLLQWLDAHGTKDKDASQDQTADGDKAASIAAYTRFKRMLPQAELDLHGLRESEARQALRAFIDRCVAQGLEKVSIIHGRGNHSREEQVLVHVVREELERNIHAGEFGFADSRHGGRGATWVRIR